MFHSDGVRHSPQFDHGPGKYRIGLIALSNDYTTERDFSNMRPSDEVTFFTSRLHFAPDCSVASLNDMASRITAAASLLVPAGRLDVVAYSCTSGTAVLGYEKVKSLIQLARNGVPCTTPLTAALEGLDRFGAQRIAVLTPYTDEVNEMIANTLEAHGKKISSFTSFKIADNELMAKITPDSLLKAAMESDMTAADALFISCTAIRAVDVVDRIERAIGKPVITAVQALYWHSLRLAGYSHVIKGFGKLLER